MSNSNFLWKKENKNSSVKKNIYKITYEINEERKPQIAEVNKYSYEGKLVYLWNLILSFFFFASDEVSLFII